MRIFLKIVKYRFLSVIKHPVVIVCLCGAVFVSIFAGVYAHKTQSDKALYPIAVVNEDNGEYSETFINRLKSNEQLDVIVLSRDKAINRVSTGRLDGAFILDEYFSRKIGQGVYEDVVEFISPTVTTSAYPVSEIVSSEVINLWLMQLVENTLTELYEDAEENTVDFETILSNIKDDYQTDDIITIEYIGENTEIKKDNLVSPIDRAVGIFASFILFAIMLSGEWVFNIKKKSLHSRFTSYNIDLTIVCLGSQLASVILSMLAFIPLILFMYFYFSLNVATIIYLTAGMLLYSLCICIIAFIVSTLVENLTQLVVVGTSAAIVNILLSSLAMPLPNWAATANAVSKIFPGTYLLGCYEQKEQLLYLLIVTTVWLIAGYISTLNIKRHSQN